MWRSDGGALARERERERDVEREAGRLYTDIVWTRISARAALHLSGREFLSVSGFHSPARPAAVVLVARVHVLRSLGVLARRHARWQRHALGSSPVATCCCMSHTSNIPSASRIRPPARRAGPAPIAIAGIGIPQRNNTTKHATHAHARLAPGRGRTRRDTRTLRESTHRAAAGPPPGAAAHGFLI